MPLTISPSQLRAARGLLDWTRAELAEISGVSEPTIQRMETGIIQPRGKTTERIIETFLEFGVEFIADDGVRKKPIGVEVLTGQAGLHQFFNNVYDYSKEHGGTIVQLGIDEMQFVNIAGTEFSESYKERMSKLVNARKDMKVLAIIREGDTNLEYASYNIYRWISKDIFAPVPFYIYGETLAIMDFQTTPSPTIIVHKFPAITKAYRKQFDVFWNLAKAPQIKK